MVVHCCARLMDKSNVFGSSLGLRQGVLLFEQQHLRKDAPADMVHARALAQHRVKSLAAPGRCLGGVFEQA